MNVLIPLLLLLQSPMSKSEFCVLGNQHAKPIMVTKGDFYLVGIHPREDGFPAQANKIDALLGEKPAVVPAVVKPVQAAPVYYYLQPQMQYAPQPYCRSGST